MSEKAFQLLEQSNKRLYWVAGDDRDHSFVAERARDCPGIKVLPEDTRFDQLVVASDLALTKGNRNVVLILVLSLIGALVYQYVFMGLMGLHDPAGLYFDQGRFLDNPSWQELTRKLPF